MGIVSMKSIYLNKKEVAKKVIIPMPFSLGLNKIVWIDDELDQALEEKNKERGFLGHKPIKLVHDINETQ
tara:strand:- start:322 stop:531 length:210 start_codon:yes stop_codon:yes gene_type:complete